MLRGLFAFLLCLTLFACQAAEENRNPLEAADAAFSQGSFLQAERGYQAYLQDYPQGKLRQKAWDRLVEIALSVRMDEKRAAELMESMYLENSYAPEKAVPVLMRLADIYMNLRDWDKAAEALQLVLSLSDSGVAERAEVHGKLGKIHQLRGELTLSREALMECMRMGVGDTKRECAFELAQTLYLLKQYGQAEQVLNEALADMEPDSEIYGRSAFLLADIMEAVGKNDEAVRLLESIIDVYPNPKAVEARLEALQGQ